MKKIELSIPNVHRVNVYREEKTLSNEGVNPTHMATIVVTVVNKDSEPVAIIRLESPVADTFCAAGNSLVLDSPVFIESK